MAGRPRDEGAGLSPPREVLEDAAAELARERLSEMLKAVAQGGLQEYFRIEVLDRPRARKRRAVETMVLVEHLPSGSVATGVDREQACEALAALLWEQRGR